VLETNTPQKIMALFIVKFKFRQLIKRVVSHHLIEVVDEYSPRELKAIVEGDTVSLSWNAPFVSEGLIGYVVYRDGQIINTNPVTDTMFIDENPSEELHSYTISSLYDNADVYFLYN
jgi:hypothetical protein